MRTIHCFVWAGVDWSPLHLACVCFHLSRHHRNLQFPISRRCLHVSSIKSRIPADLDL